MWTALVLLCAACSSGGNDSKSASPAATVARATTTTDPYAVPTTIDIPYLNRVFAALDHINGEATRRIVAARAITPEAAALLSALFAKSEFEAQAEAFNDAIDAGLPTYRKPPGDRITHVSKILVARSDCVAVEVERDYSAVTVTPPATPHALVALGPHARTELNPTPWIVLAQLKSGTLPCG